MTLLLDTINNSWEEGRLKNWRHREILAGQVAGLFEAHTGVEYIEACSDLLRHGLYDPYQAVRLAAVKGISRCYAAVKERTERADKIQEILEDLATSPAFKSRRT